MSRGAPAFEGKPSAARSSRAVAKTQRTEAIRLIRALGSLMVAEKVGAWMRKPNRNFGGLAPIQLIERGKLEPLRRMIYEIDSGQPDRRGNGRQLVIDDRFAAASLQFGASQTAG